LSGQIYFDMAGLANATAIGKGRSPVKERLLQYTREVLIKRLYVNKSNDRVKGYSGLSLCSPFRPRHVPLDCYDRKPYRDYLRVLRSFQVAAP